MAISSIHIATGKAGYFHHNDRSNPTQNSIFFDEKNEVNLSAREAFKIYRSELNKRINNYVKKTGQKFQSKTITHLSAIINLNKHHKLADLEPLKNYLEKELDTKVIQIAIHRDEGHLNEAGEKVKNYHAHFEFLGIDSNGRSIRRKLSKNFLKNLQTKTAEILKMERGKIASKKKRLDTYEFKEYKKRENATVKQLKNEIKSLRKNLSGIGLLQSDFKRVNELNKDLEKKIKNKELKIDEMQLQINSLKIELKNEAEKRQKEEEEKKRLEELKRKQEDENDRLKKQFQSQKLDFEIEKRRMIVNNKKNIQDSYFKKLYETAKAEVEKVVEALKDLFQKYEDQKKEIKQLKEQLSKKDDEIKKLKNEQQLKGLIKKEDLIEELTKQKQNEIVIPKVEGRRNYFKL